MELGISGWRWKWSKVKERSDGRGRDAVWRKGDEREVSMKVVKGKTR